MNYKAKLIAKIWNMINKTHRNRDYERLWQLGERELESINEECITWLNCKEEEIGDDIEIKWKDGTTTKMINGEIVTHRSITN